MKNSISKYQIGWIGIRASKAGRAANLLKKDGWMKTQGHASLNNRDGFDWIRPLKTQDQFEATDWTRYSFKGLEGIAVWFTDAQWETQTGLTAAQWNNRSIIEDEFNKICPTGKSR